MASELKALLCPSWRTISSSGMRRHVGDDERLAAREHLLDLGVLREVDGQVAQLLVVARGDDVADVARLAHEDDAHAVDLRDLGDALDDREEDAAEIEVRRQRLRELEDEPRVLLLLRERLDEAANAELPADARDELDGLERLAHEVVGARLEGPRDLLVGLERREHDDGQVARLRPRAQDAQDLVAVRRRHHQIEQHDRRLHPLDLLERLGARADRHVRKVGIRERLNQDMSTDGVVVDDEDGATRHVQKCTRRSRVGANRIALLSRSAGSVLDCVPDLV